MNFSYAATPVGSDIHHMLLKRGLVEFTQFKNKRKITGTRRKDFDYWWNWYGPLGFKTNEDSFEHRKQLWNFIEGLTNGIEDVIISTNES